MSHKNPKHMPRAPTEQEEKKWLLKEEIWFLIYIF